MKLSNVQLAILSLIIANIIWGAGIPIFKWTMQDIPPITFAFLRFFFSALILLPFTIHKLKIRSSDLKIFLFLAIVGTALRIAYNFYGLKYAPSINDLIITSTAPVFLLIGARSFLHEKMEKKVVKGTLLSFLGVVVIILQPVLTNGFDVSFVGNFFLIISMCLSVMYTLVIKKLSSRYSALTLLFWTFAFAAVSLLPLAAFEIDKGNFLASINTQGILGLSFSVLFCTLIAYNLEIFGLRYIKANQVGIFSYVDPFVGIAVANPLLGEQITTTFFIGSFLVFLGIFIAEGRIHYHPLHLLHEHDQKLKEQPVPVHE